jgi:hypothetical protein
VSSGKWSLSFTGASWAKVAQLSEGRIVYGNVSIVWVQRNQIGLARDSGTDVFLAPGLHVYNDPGFVFERVVDTIEEYIHHGTLHIVRVPKSMVAKVWAAKSQGGLEPRVLKEGLHIIDSSLFRYEGLASTFDQHVQHGSLHLMRVPRAWVAKITDDGTPMVLGEGYHFIEGSSLHYQGLSPLSDKVITHNRITLFKVAKGEIGMGFQNHEPVMFENPGSYGFDDPNFVFVRHQSTNDRIVELGSKKIINVREGEVGMTHDHGILKMLPPGRHRLEDPSQTFDGFLAMESGLHPSQQMTVMCVPKKQCMCCTISPEPTCTLPFE